MSARSPCESGREYFFARECQEPKASFFDCSVGVSVPSQNWNSPPFQNLPISCS